MQKSSEYRFILTKYAGPDSRDDCPFCGHKKCFAQYFDTTTGEVLADNVGRCNREDKCSAHYSPAQYFKDNPQERKRFFDTDTDYNSFSSTSNRPAYTPKPVENKPTSYIDPTLFKRSLTAYESNNLYLFLCAKFGEDIATEKTVEYHLGTSKQWGQNCCVYWQIDEAGKIRTGKIMYVDATTGKRVKEPFSHITWVHSALKMEGYNLKQCLFGLHLAFIQENLHKPICIVESEKTAIIASIYMPQYVWMATGAKLHLNEALFNPIAGREVTFYPDLGAYGEWCVRADKLKHLISVTVDTTLQEIATEEERGEGLDIADYLLRNDYQQVKLMDGFINDMLQATDEDGTQKSILSKYISKGMGKEQALKAVEILMNNHGFKTA